LILSLARVPGVVWLIFTACLLPEFYLSGADLGLWGTPEARNLAIDYFGFWPGPDNGALAQYAGQRFVMFLSYAFLHAGLLHFGVNMATLFSLGPPVQRILGSSRFLLLYLALGVAGGLGYALWPVGNLPMIGASGALFGLAGVILAWEVQRRRLLHISLRPVINNVIYLVGLNVVLWAALSGQLAWQTHLGGFIAGWAFAQFSSPYRR